jgi:putative hydrolase of the HAD superfamily
MEKKSWKPIRDFLNDLEPLRPIETEIKEKLSDIPNSKAFIFDIYGTLIISDSGDIDHATFASGNLLQAINKAGIPIHVNDEEEKTEFLKEILEKFKNTIAHIHTEKKENNIPFPEINIISVWEEVLESFSEEGKISVPDDKDIRIFSFLFELMSNKIYSMPHMKEVLTKLKSQGYPLGIVSNAQFYTPVIMNFLLENEITDKEFIYHFEPELTFYSYKYGISKPDTQLFYNLKKSLKNHYGIRPEEALYIGNDMYNDIYPASKTGFRTALFAGDKRSLRLREDIPLIKNVKPDLIIKDLGRLLEFTG